MNKQSLMFTSLCVGLLFLPIPSFTQEGPIDEIVVTGTKLKATDVNIKMQVLKSAKIRVISPSTDGKRKELKSRDTSRKSSSGPGIPEDTQEYLDTNDKLIQALAEKAKEDYLFKDEIQENKMILK